jgi:hypothetical protein
MTLLVDVDAMLDTEREALSETFTSLLSGKSSFRSELKDASLFLVGCLDQQEKELEVLYEETWMRLVVQ